jgi:tetratricopeptide (TPR) repeat protein
MHYGVYMKRRYYLFSALACGICMSSQGVCNDAPNTKELIKIVKDLETHHSRLTKDIIRIKRLLHIDSKLSNVALILPNKEMTKESKGYTNEGIEKYNAQEYDEAKEYFQSAWEEAPNSYVTNFNLALCYYHLGNMPLAKKMMKASIDIKEDLPNKEALDDFLSDTLVDDDENDADDDDALTDEEKEIHTYVINMKKEIESYMKSTSMPFHSKIKAIIHNLETITEKISGHDKLIHQFNLSLAEVYTNYEYYSAAYGLLGEYEKSMEGKILPDNFYTKKLSLENMLKKQDLTIKGYENSDLDDALKYTLSRDLHELEIFGSQMENFVSTTQENDNDFSTLCQRLKEYRWGNKLNRHVMVINRFQKLLYSSLPGTLSLDRYKDTTGKTFLKDITLLGKSLDEKKATYFNVDLTVRGKVIPYVVMYTYIPKHEAFIVIRLPREDLTS